MINANATLKKQIRGMKSKQAVGNAIREDDVPMDFDNKPKQSSNLDSTGQSPANAKGFNPQKHTISELEKQIEVLKKSKDALVQKHLNYKVNSDRMIEKLSNLNTTANLKICDNDKQIKFYIQKVKEFMKKNINMLSKEHLVELENILAGKGKAAKTEDV